MRKCILAAFLAICLFGWTGCNNDNSTGPVIQTPTVSSFSPGNVSRGQKDVVGTIHGTNLNGSVSVSFGDGINVTQVTGVNSLEVEIQFDVANNASTGARTITVTTAGGTATFAGALTVDSNRAPTAKIAISPSFGAKNTLFRFSGLASDDPDGELDSYKWEFGDDTKAHGPEETHTFASTGTFQVTLTVRDNDGATSTDVKNVEVRDGTAPTVAFVLTPATIEEDNIVHCDASASSDDGTIVEYRWDFGDGQTGKGATIDHLYSSSGDFVVTLQLTDDEGFKNVGQKKVKVKPFDDLAAVQEIQSVLTRFFFRFSQLETLSAEAIVDGWSFNCLGREHEINIIEQQKTQVQSTDNHIIDAIGVSIRSDHLSATADVTAQFDFTLNDGTPQSSVCTHFFTMVRENGEWLVCDFTVSCQ